MSKKRYIDTKFWSDNWVTDKLNPLDRYLFLYLLTNSKTNVAGVYEISLRTVSFETGIEREELARMLANLEPKVIYVNNWIVLRNTIRHQNYTNTNVAAGIRDALKHCPAELLEYIDFPADFQVEVAVPKKKKSHGYKVTASKRFRILRRDSYTCQYCGAKAPDAVLHVDHRIPISKGGTNDDDNLVTACDGCNLGKYDSDASEDSLTASKGLKESSSPSKGLQGSSSNIDFDSDFDFDSDVAAERPQKAAAAPKKTKPPEKLFKRITAVLKTQAKAEANVYILEVIAELSKIYTHDEIVAAASYAQRMAESGRDPWLKEKQPGERLNYLFNTSQGSKIKTHEKRLVGSVKRYSDWILKAKEDTTFATQDQSQQPITPEAVAEQTAYDLEQEKRDAERHRRIHERALLRNQETDAV